MCRLTHASSAVVTLIVRIDCRCVSRETSSERPESLHRATSSQLRASHSSQGTRHARRRARRGRRRRQRRDDERANAHRATARTTAHPPLWTHAQPQRTTAADSTVPRCSSRRCCNYAHDVFRRATRSPRTSNALPAVRQPHVEQTSCRSPSISGQSHEARSACFT